uniref:Uncharacterized protein n=1 Tax=Neovison vison TaxID=452646 RepID=A0A8C7EMA8_NEOVI
MASILELTCIYLTFILHDNEVIQLRRKWKQRKKNLRNLMMTWALVFLPHFFCDLFSKKLNSWGEGSRSGRDRIYKRK